MKPTLIILIGPPCTGKSTWSKEYVRNNVDALRFNRDDIRLMLSGVPVLSSIGEHVVTKMIDIGIQDGLSSGRDCIIDQTNCRLTYINKFVRQFKDSSDIKFKIFRESLDVLLERNIQRSKETKLSQIPKHIMEIMYINQITMLNNEEFIKILEEHGHLD